MTLKAEMTVAQHVQTALAFLDHSDQEFVDGDALQGSEKLWGAASHAITAIAKQRGWPFGKYRARAEAVKRLADEYGDPLLDAYFSVARQFRNNFYRDFMEDEDIQDDRPKVHNFVNRIVEIVRESRNDEG